ncbi:glyoxylate/hydroxypyruvate reductase A [Massilia sp. Dwa41.01b]|uniref:2-hydroxyacid dehydrogenase n=1 Tax=unclassified Massilia TaxID=2609279 RepID=UPI001600477E|nr:MULTISPECIES: glyoxylate/hydroxypyruvate reductase A [unclassified Massilia]QNA87338.1 glyoxylate/hydroxypyruvate reductase A [Massilia sp. Dwa41.01b]QNA98246.1 glyoxylate/hydroxypyruvate reductase A [Massilia sp. Se16.2.3]
MRVLLYRGDGQIGPWAEDFARALPGAETVGWQEGDTLGACDYAVLWSPSPNLLPQLAGLKAIFLMGAGADAVLKFGDALPAVPIVRLGDAGMAMQMAEYVTWALLRYFRRFDEYEEQRRHGLWSPLPVYRKEDFTVGVMGIGKLGLPVVEALRAFGFPVRVWSRTPKEVTGVACYAGLDALDDFLRGTRVLVSLLPLTSETNNLLDRRRLATLPQGAYLINVARGAQVAEPDLLALIRAKHIAGATLDVFRNEPLPAQHPFWDEPRITITPHISAVTLREEAVLQIVDKIAAFEAGRPVADIVDRALGY